MGITDAIREKPTVGIAIVAVVFAVIVVMRMRTAGAAEAGSRFYYDVGTRQLVAYKASEALPPVTLASGNEGVLAHVYACGDCETSEHFVAYLEKFTDEYRERALADPNVVQGPIITDEKGNLVAEHSADGAALTWEEISSAEGKAILKAARDKCTGTAKNRPTECMP